MPEAGMTQNTPEKSGRRFLKGALILAVAGIVVKVIGSLNWIFLSYLIRNFAQPLQITQTASNKMMSWL